MHSCSFFENLIYFSCYVKYSIFTTNISVHFDRKQHLKVHGKSHYQQFRSPCYVHPMHLLSCIVVYPLSLTQVTVGVHGLETRQGGRNKTSPPGLWSQTIPPERPHLPSFFLPVKIACQYHTISSKLVALPKTDLLSYPPKSSYCFFKRS